MLLHVAEQGQGTPVCLLHGLFGRSQNLTALARALAGRHRVLALDLRNHGVSPHAPDMRTETMAADVLETLEAKGAPVCAVLGHSMGGKVAMTAALMRPEAVARLVVADIAPLAYRHHNRQVAAALRALVLSPGLERRAADTALAASVPEPATRGFLLQNLAFGAGPAWRIGLDEIAAGMADIEGWSLPEGAAAYAGPVLFVAGGRSDYLVGEGWLAAQALFAQARLVVLQDAGHWLHADQPAAFLDAVSGFFGE